MFHFFVLSFTDNEKVSHYIGSPQHPFGSFSFAGDMIIGENWAHMVTGFSSWGPIRLPLNSLSLISWRQGRMFWGPGEVITD